MGYQQLGTVYQAMGRDNEALANYQRSIAIRPAPPAYTNIGMILHEQGDFAGAVKAYQQALALRPSSVVAHRNLGDALLRLGRADEARASYLNAVKYAEAELSVNPADIRTLSALAVYLQKSGQAARAQSRISEALAKAPDNAEVNFRAGVIAALAGEGERALDFLERAAAKGYSKQSIQTDDDLSSLYQSPRFKQLTKE
jgi:tetratricopeptide (TPR) repeat protein